jgi:hypothetical protein
MNDAPETMLHASDDAEDDLQGIEDETAAVLDPEADELSSVDLRIARIEAAINLRQRRARYVSYLLAGFATVSLLSAVLGRDLLPNLHLSSRALGFGGLMYSLLLMGAAWFATQTRISSMLQDLEIAKAKRRILKRARGSPTSTPEAPASYFDKLVDINVTNLGAYYTMVKFHANNSFLVTIGVATIGFGLIIFGLIVGFYRGATDNSLTYISTGAGVGTEFISSIFFYLYNRTVRQLKDYHDSLLSVQNVLLSFKIVGDTTKEADRVKIVSKMIEYLLGKDRQRSVQEYEPKSTDQGKKSAGGRSHAVRGER